MLLALQNLETPADLISPNPGGPVDRAGPRGAETAAQGSTDPPRDALQTQIESFCKMRSVS